MNIGQSSITPYPEITSDHSTITNQPTNHFSSVSTTNYQSSTNNRFIRIIDQEATLYLDKVAMFPRNIAVQTRHVNWWMCRDDFVWGRDTKVYLSYDKSSGNMMSRCSYVFVPIKGNENPMENCNEALKPFSPLTIPGQSSKCINENPNPSPAARVPSPVAGPPHVDTGGD